MTPEDEIATRAEWIRQQTEKVQTLVGALQAEQAVMRTTLQCLLAQYVKSAGADGLEALRIQTTATLASPVVGSGGDNPERQDLLQAIAMKFFDGAYEAAGLTKPKMWGGDA